MRGSANWHAWRVAAAASLSAAGASQNVKAKEGLAVATADQALAVDNFTLGLATRQRGLAGLRLATIAQVLACDSRHHGPLGRCRPPCAGAGHRAVLQGKDHPSYCRL